MYTTPFHTQDLTKLSFLITGGSGFIGSNLVEYLIKYNAGKVRVLDNLLTSSIENIKPFIGLPEFLNLLKVISGIQKCAEKLVKILILFLIRLHWDPFPVR